MSLRPDEVRPEAGLAVDPDLLAGRNLAVWPGSDVLVAVSAGGACGALARYGLARLVTAEVWGLGWATFTANVLGSLLLGLLTAVVVARFPDQRLVRPFLGVGLLGSFTTYSTFAVELETQLAGGQLGVALVAGVVSVAAGVLAAAGGLWLGRTFTRR